MICSQSTGSEGSEDPHGGSMSRRDAGGTILFLVFVLLSLFLFLFFWGEKRSRLGRARVSKAAGNEALRGAHGERSKE